MLYRSTRGKCASVISSEAIKKGLAEDGGLFVPENIIHFNNEQI
jgi:threonine synthase